MRRILAYGVIAAGLGLGTACGSADPARPHPPASSSTAAQPLPAPRLDRVVRILGTGDGRTALPPGRHPAASSPVYLPGALAVDGDRLLGAQWSLPTVYALGADGTVDSFPDPVTEDGDVKVGRRVGFREQTLAGLLTDGRYLVLTSSGTVESARLSDVSSPAVSRLGRSITSGSLVTWAGATHVITPQGWYRVDAVTAAVAPERASVDGALVAGADGARLVVLTSTDVVTVGSDGAVTARARWVLPAQQRGLRPTGATADGTGGLLVTVARPGNPSGSRSGALLRISGDGGVTVLAHGAASPQDGCDRVSSATDDAPFAQPVSVARWGARVVVADRRCGTVLQLALPAD